MLSFVLGIAGSAALLIYAVRMVRTGVERAFAVQLRRWLRQSSRNAVLAALSGGAAALAMQSATAVAILAAGFIAAGSITPAVGLALLLGADVGSALVVQVLVLRPEWLAPALLLIGVATFLRSEAKSYRQVGRIVIGLALIFVALDMIAQATGPLRDSAGLMGAIRYLETDPVSAFVIGAIFAWAVHSSVAAVLLCMTFAAQGLVPVPTAMAMVLGANLGGSFIAVTLTLAADVGARRMVLANLILRGGGAAAVLVGMTTWAPDWAWLGATAERQVINLHLLFNLGVAVLCLPVIPLAMWLTGVMVRQPAAAPQELARRSALDPQAQNDPERALICAAREVLHMGEAVETMLRPALRLYYHWDDATARAILNAEAELDQMHFATKTYLARSGRHSSDPDLTRRSAELVDLAAHLEAAGDAVSRVMLGLARKMHDEKLRFSVAGQSELSDFHDVVLTNAQAALNVQMSRNPEAARSLVTQKERVRDLEQALQRAHLGRLRQANEDSFATSNIHQETLRALKQINTAFTMVAYPILTESGDLLSSRLSAGP
jgi:phosphate:Na+ symporter